MNPSDDQSQSISFFTSLWRSQATAFIASATDFSVYVILLHLIGIYYVTASGISAICGAIVSFYLGRNWAFKNKNGKITNQMIKYAIASGLSLILNVYGIYFIVETFDLDETISKVVTSITIGLFVNFPVFRYWVFKK